MKSVKVKAIRTLAPRGATGRASALALSAAASALILAPFAASAQQVASAQPTASPSAPAATAPASGSAGAPSTAAAPAAQGGGIRWEKTFPSIASGEWKGKRLADGQPDVEGHWSNTIANHNNWTDPQAGEPGGRKPRTTRAERAPSRVSDPADGEVPFQPWARAVQQEFATNFSNPTRPEYIEPLARCAPAGIPKSFIWHGYEVRQYPGYVLILFNSGSRIIHLDGKPHLPDTIKLWNADSRGHWEGNTLVVDVTNNNSKARFGRTGEFASDNVHIVEKFIFSNDGQRYNYVATFTDPTVYTRSWTATIPARRRTVTDEQDGWHWEGEVANRPGKPPLAEFYERICVENNDGFGNVAVAPSAASPK